MRFIPSPRFLLYPLQVAKGLQGQQIAASAVRHMRGHKLSPTCVVLSPDDTTAFSGSKDNSILRWDVETGKRIAMLPHWRKLPGGKVPAVKAHSKEVSQPRRGITPLVAVIWCYPGGIMITVLLYDVSYRDLARCLPLQLAATAGTWHREVEIGSLTCGIAVLTAWWRHSAGTKTRFLRSRSGPTAWRSFPGPTIDASRCDGQLARADSSMFVGQTILCNQIRTVPWLSEIVY